MKKIFGTLAMALCLTAMVSCGGSDKKDNNNNDQQTEQTAEPKDVVAKAKEYTAQIEAADKRGDYEAVERLNEEAEAWLEGLSEADQEKVINALMGE